MPVTKLHEDKPQALFIVPEDNMIDLTNSYLAGIEKLEDMNLDEFLRKAKNNE